jgi:hypothetical protein
VAKTAAVGIPRHTPTQQTSNDFILNREFQSMNYDKEIHDLRRWREELERSVFSLLMAQLDAASISIFLASWRHGPSRIEHLQNARRMYEAIWRVHSSGLLAPSHRRKIDSRLARLKSTLQSLGAVSLATYLP